MLRADHFAFQVSDMDRAIRFYTESLGLKLLFRESIAEHQEEVAFLELDGGNLELLKKLDSSTFKPKAPVSPYCPHLALSTDDMNTTLAMVQEKNLPIVKGPLEVAGKVKWLYISDPDQNVIEFIQWLEN